MQFTDKGYYLSTSKYHLFAYQKLWLLEYLQGDLSRDPFFPPRVFGKKE